MPPRTIPLDPQPRNGRLVDALRFNWKHIALIVGMSGVWYDTRYRVTRLEDMLADTKRQVTTVEAKIAERQQEAANQLQDGIDGASEDAQQAWRQVAALRREVVALQHRKPKPLPPDVFPGGRRLYGRSG